VQFLGNGEGYRGGRTRFSRKIAECRLKDVTFFLVGAISEELDLQKLYQHSACILMTILEDGPIEAPPDFDGCEVLIQTKSRILIGNPYGPT